MSASVLGRHKRIAVDSNVLIYLFEDSGELADKAGELLDWIGEGRAEGAMATLAIAEICSGPAAAGELALVERYADELGSLENVQLVALTADLAADAAVLRGSGSLTLADAIHLASARHAGASAFVTNDRRIKAIAKLDVIYLSEI
jgi:predicted nucleic acid-binding protein